MLAMDTTAEKPSFADLKVGELLKEVRVEYPTTEAVEAAVSAIRSCLHQIPEHQVTSSLAPSFVEDLGVPAHKAKFSFKCPELVEIVGSFAVRAMAKPVQTIDLAVYIPKNCFQEKDFLNHRYHAKRALYLAAVQKHMARCSIVRSTKWTLLHHDGRKPLLLVQLADDLGFDFKFDILLVPVIRREVFTISKLAPSRNNLRTSLSGMGPETTPHYNASILEDMDMQAHCSYLNTAFSQHDGLRDTVLLLKVWMRQRGFADMSDSFNGFLMSMLLAHLINTGERKIASNMNAFQLFRICIEILAGGHFLEKGLFFKQASSKIDRERGKAYFQYFDVVMFDSSDLYNMAFRLTKDALKEIKEAACGTIAAMKSSRDCGFDEVFMTAIDFSAKFDYHVRICMKHQALESLKPPSFADEDKCRDVERQVERILSSGLGDRASLVRVYGRTLPPNWILEGGVHASRTLPIFVGINARNFDVAYRMVDAGPSADNTDEAAKFRSFWGEKAELRRFKDGTINETAVWECDSMQRHLILQNIVGHLLLRHLSLSSSDIYVTAGQLDFALMEGKKDPSASGPKLLEAFNALSKRIRGLDDLPLKISSIQPLHAAFRHAAVFPPEVHVLADGRPTEGFSHEWVAACADPCEVMVQLEGSGRWPSNQEAIAKTKIAFCLKIAESMHRLYGVKCVAAEDSVDLLMHGFCFRLKVYYDKDPTLVQTRHDKVHHMAMESIHLPDKNMDLLHKLKNDLMLQSLHSSMLSGLHGRYPIYGPTVRLAKRWVGSHLFSDVLQDEAVDLLVAYLFLKPASYSPPLSRITGFLRFLQLLKNYDWALSPLIVDLNGDFTAKELDFILDEFHRVRKQEPSNELQKADQRWAAMFIATPYDMRSHTWTALSPSCMTLKRLVAYARTSAELLSKLIKGETPEKWHSLFRTPLNLYDVILKIQPSKLAHPLRVLFPADIKAAAKVVIRSSKDDFMAWLPGAAAHRGLIDVEKQLLIGFDPTLCLLQDLKVKFGDLFSFWYDHIGSPVIGLNWKIQSNQASAKKRKRLEEQEDILIELGRMGEGFLESVHVVASP